MSESFADLEDMIRGLAKDVHPAVSLRQRILTASHIARERQLRRTRIRRASGWCLMCLCLIYAGAQVPWSSFPTLGGPDDSSRFVARVPAVQDSPALMGSVPPAVASQAEVSSPVCNERVEWEMAESHWKRRDRQSALLSHYF